MLLSVVVAALNSEVTIGQTLSSIFSNDLSRNEFEVIVVDNGSTDRTVEVAKRYPVKLYSCLNPGQGAARNLGVMKTSGEIVCFTDSDVIVSEDWLRKILEFFSTHPDAEGVGGPVLAPLGGYVNSLQKMVGKLYARTHDFCASIVEAEYREKRNALYSANCAYRKAVLLSSGGFDDSGFDAVDIDLCWRLLPRGTRLLFDPEIKVAHLGFPSCLRSVFRQQFRWGKSEARLKMRHPDELGLRRRILPYYSLLLSFLRVVYSRSRDLSLLHLYESCAFICGFISGYVRANRRR